MTRNVRRANIKGMVYLSKISYKVFLTLFLVSAMVSVFALRHNNETMIQLRNGVYAADKRGEGVEAALTELRTYVYGHMNTDLSSGGNAIKPPIQLKHTYERLALEADKKANKSQLYTEAENYCQAKIPASVSGRARVPCVEEYIMGHGGQKAEPVPAGLYQFDFISPSWSPDLAGWSVIASILFFGLSAVTFLRQRLF